jgi:hypothetical protein
MLVALARKLIIAASWRCLVGGIAPGSALTRA